MATTEALPGCPCCGGAAEFAVGEHSFHDVKVRCTVCDLESGLFDAFDTVAKNRAAAAAAWGQRVPTAASAQVIEQALAFVQEESAAFKECHTTADGAWPEAEDRETWDAMASLEARLAALLPPSAAKAVATAPARGH